MKLKTKLLPICGALGATAAIVTPLATSCSGWTRYTDMLSEYKSGVKPYKETMFVEPLEEIAQYDVDELYGAQFEKNHDILRDDMLGSLSKIMCYENTPATEEGGGFFNTAFKEINKYDFDIHVDEVIPYDEEGYYFFDPGDEDFYGIYDNSSIQFTIDLDFKAKFNNKPEVELEDEEDTRYIDIIDIDLQFKTIDPGIIGFENDTTDAEMFDDDGIMSLYRPLIGKISEGAITQGMVCIDADVSYRYSFIKDKEGEKGEKYHEHDDVRDLDALVTNMDEEKCIPELTETTSVYTFFFGYFVAPLNGHIGQLEDVEDVGATDYFAFCSHYLENVDTYVPA